MSERVDVVLDLETLGIKPGSVVLQVGAIAFRRQGGEVLASFDRNIDIGSSLMAGLEVSPEAVRWWRGQSDEARASVFAIGDALRLVAASFRQFWVSAGCDAASCLWARGADFDPPIWAAALKAADGLDPPWRYSRVRDIRTALDVARFDRGALPFGVERHVAIHDAGHDLDCLIAAGVLA